LREFYIPFPKSDFDLATDPSQIRNKRLPIASKGKSADENKIIDDTRRHDYRDDKIRQR
jgi:hypothetical protein